MVSCTEYPAGAEEHLLVWLPPRGTPFRCSETIHGANQGTESEIGIITSSWCELEHLHSHNSCASDLRPAHEWKSPKGCCSSELCVLNFVKGNYFNSRGVVGKLSWVGLPLQKRWEEEKKEIIFLCWQLNKTGKVRMGEEVIFCCCYKLTFLQHSRIRWGRTAIYLCLSHNVCYLCQYLYVSFVCI